MTDGDRSELEPQDRLAADQALWGRDASSMDALDQALRASGRPAATDTCIESWERAAAECTLALLHAAEPSPQAMPAAVESQVRRQLTALATAAAPSATEGHAPRQLPRRNILWPSLAAAVVLVAGMVVGRWLTRGFDGDAKSDGDPIARVAEAEDATELQLERGPSPLAGEAPGGDLVWSDRRQEGYMRIRGLPANDPTKRQYQLWIFDAQRAAPDQPLLEMTPVDGGIFNIPPGATDTVVPIDAKIPIGRGAAFAVTVEAPGGVVVSDREHIVLLAK